MQVYNEIIDLMAHFCVVINRICSNNARNLFKLIPCLKNIGIERIATYHLYCLVAKRYIPITDIHIFGTLFWACTKSFVAMCAVTSFAREIILVSVRIHWFIIIIRGIILGEKKEYKDKKWIKNFSKCVNKNTFLIYSSRLYWIFWPNSEQGVYTWTWIMLLWDLYLLL